MPKDYKSISQAVQSDLPSIGKIRKSDPEIINEVLIEFISDFVQFLNVGKIMNVSQINQTSKLISQYFPHLNLADLKVFFEKMKIGQFGLFYDRMDGQLILEKLEAYNQERMNVVEGMNNDHHKQLKKQSFDASTYHPNVINAIKEAIGDKKPLWHNKINNSSTENQSIKCDLTQRWFRQFDNLHKKFGKNIAGMRHLVFNEKIHFSIETFIERKFTNYQKTH